MVEKLAIEGGQPIRRDPWPSRVHVDFKEFAEVLEVIAGASKDPNKLWRTGGPKVKEFEDSFAAFHGLKYAVSSSTGTAAVHLPILALSGIEEKLKPGTEVVTAPITDPGTVMPLIIHNVVPIFADVDPLTLNITPESVEACINDKTRAIIVVHLAGLVVDMDGIMKLAKKHDLTVIEDCAQAHGAEYKGKKVGSIGDYGCFSLMAGKHITSGGEGGMTLAKTEEAWKNLHYVARSRWMPHSEIGRGLPWPLLNYRMTELQAACGLAQLPKLPSIVSRRRELNERLQRGLSRFRTVKPSKIVEGSKPSYWFSMLHVDTDAIRVSIDKFAEALGKEGIPCGARYIVIPMYEFGFIKDRQDRYPWTLPEARKGIVYKDSCPNAVKALNGVITLWLHENCTEKEVDDIIAAVEKLEAEYAK
jgi:dTDP-4-amino-4,6-dideoxygalactose transaminase